MDDDTLQPDANLEADNEAIEQDVDGMPEGADEAPAEVNEEKKVTFDTDQQQFVDKLIGGKVKQARDAEREAESLKARLTDLEAKLPKETRPDVPDMPDMYADNIDEKMRQRDEAIKSAAAFDARQTVLQEQNVEAQRRQVFEQQQAFNEKVVSYQDKGKKLGISDAEMNVSGKALVDSGISVELQQHILGDENGPLIADYLSKNPIELDGLRHMDTISAAVKIATSVTANAKAARKPTSAPAPADTLNGGGSPSGERGPKGATFA